MGPHSLQGKECVCVCVCVFALVIIAVLQWFGKKKVVLLYFACVLSCFSCVQLFVTLWTVARQVPLSMGFSRQEYWSGLPCPPPGDLPDPGTKLVSLMSLAFTRRFFTTIATWKALFLTLGTFY